MKNSGDSLESKNLKDYIKLKTIIVIFIFSILSLQMNTLSLENEKLFS